MKKVILSAFLALSLSSTFSCSSDGMNNSTEMSSSSSENLYQKRGSFDINGIVSKLVIDKDFKVYVNTLETLSTKKITKNGDYFLKLMSRDEALSEEEFAYYTRQMGFKETEEFKNFFKTHISSLNAIVDTYKLDKLDEDTRFVIFDKAISTVLYGGNNRCEVARSACRSSAGVEYTQALLGCGSATVAAATLSGWTGVGAVASVVGGLGCAGYAAYNYGNQLDLCKSNYEQCMKNKI